MFNFLTFSGLPRVTSFCRTHFHWNFCWPNCMLPKRTHQTVGGQKLCTSWGQPCVPPMIKPRILLTHVGPINLVDGFHHFETLFFSYSIYYLKFYVSMLTIMNFAIKSKNLFYNSLKFKYFWVKNFISF